MKKSTKTEQLQRWAQNYNYKSLNCFAKRLYGQVTQQNKRNVMTLIYKLERKNLITFSKMNSGVLLTPAGYKSFK